MRANTIGTLTELCESGTLLIYFHHTLYLKTLSLKMPFSVTNNDFFKQHLPFTSTFFQQPTLCSIPSHLCWQLTTPKSPWKASRGFKLLSLKVPLKAFPLWCEECYRSSWKLTSAAIYCAGFCHYVEDKYGFHHGRNVTEKKKTPVESLIRRQAR